ncbi:MAG: filamentous hemagglutinin N-terminal domain-containing protein, partial [Rhodospirillales bacterium]|nr:filamentous hemagglutinin N-terminal domain-containing protein [Rhodospirillales bacterium]
MTEAIPPRERQPAHRAAARRSARWGRRRLRGAQFGWPLALALGSTLAAPVHAQNLPQGGTVVGGSGTIQQIDANLLQIQQNSQNLAIDWQSFNVGPSGIVRFLQPSSSAIALNRVIGNDPSAIFGQIQANGQVILLNPRGIYFGPGSMVDVNAMVATTANIRNDDFMAGRLRFEEGSGDANARVVNEGLVSVAQGGFAILAAASVQNTGRIVANGGTVVLAGTKTFTVDFHGDGLLSFAATGTVEQAASGASALVDNSGIIEATGGRVLMTARAARDVLDNVINTTGIVVARSAQMVNGEIVIDGGDNGVVNVAGTLDASGRGAGQTGGTVKVLGESVRLSAGASIDAAGDAGGGTALVGGNYQGRGPERNARIAYMDAAAVIDASALTAGDGGRVIVWADDTAHMAGTISARGGALSGAGGFVETSGKNRISIADTARVYTTGATGNAGNWLIDPTDFTVAFSGGDMTGATLITNLLAGNVTINSNSGGSGTTGTIYINDAVINTAAAARSLTLEAAGGIEINSAISSTISTLDLNLRAAGGNITVAASVSTNGGSIQTSGAGGTGSAAGSFSNTAGINTGGGNITLAQTGGVSIGGNITTSGTVTIDAGST